MTCECDCSISGPDYSFIVLIDHCHVKHPSLV